MRFILCMLVGLAVLAVLTLVSPFLIVYGIGDNVLDFVGFVRTERQKAKAE